MTDVATRLRPGTSLKGFAAPILLIGGVVVAPTALGLLFTSWSTPDDEASVRMAFATVAGATLAIATVVGVLVDRIIRRATVSTIAIFAVIALVVVPYELNAISGAAELLLARLSS